MLLLGYLLLALVVAAVIFYAIVALLPSGISLPPEHDDRPFVLPPDRRMRAQDLDDVRIPVSLRGYRFAETDDLIDRLAAEIVVRDEEIALLRQQSQASRQGLADPGPVQPARVQGLVRPSPGTAEAAESDHAAARHAETGAPDGDADSDSDSDADADSDARQLPRGDGSGR